ncbi:MAG: phytoene desaturase family protein [Novosphingobium sp.]|uniref:phytoene desaturase family protein n=1 Tax=Novosphingobium sp. TaxID=1874826 RepID=UPI0032BAF3BC
MAKRTHSNTHDPARAVCVIGAGLGGLALAIRLQAAGLPTTLIEARGEVGGLIRRIAGHPFAFEEGPGLLADPAPLRELWSLTEEDAEPALQLQPVDPACRFLWSDGTQFEAAADPAELLRQVARIAPGDAGRLDEWREWTGLIRREAWPRLAESGLSGSADLGRAVAALRHGRLWQSPWQRAARLFEEPHLRQALALPALLSGANPLNSSALVLGGQHLAGAGPGFWPLGGMARLADTMAARFTALGGVIRLHDPVVRIHCLGNRASEVETLSGWRTHFAAIASAADAVQTYRTLLKDTARGKAMGARLAQRRFSPSALTVHFALAGSWPGIAHQSVLLGPRFADLMGDLFDTGVLPRDMLIWLHHPTVTDPALAPDGHSLMRATIPVAHLGKLPIDWDSAGPMIAGRILAEIGRRLIPDIQDRILAQCITTPRDLALDPGVHLGSGWSLEQCPSQSGPLRLAHHDRKIANLYLAGAATHPGAGVAGVLAGAKACSAAIVGSIV